VTRETPPQPNELEISVIGPGRGECILVHLGNNEWCVIDSCVARDSTEPVAVDYLRSFHNNAMDGVRLVVATHWHDDHIRGLASVLKSSRNAKFACSAALEKEIFMELVALSEQSLPGRSGVQEFASIFELLLERADRSMLRHLVSPMYAGVNRKLLSLPSTGRPFAIGITSLSPSDGAITLALKQIGSLIPKPGDPQRRIVAQSPNHTSVVIWVEAGPRNALLGADLEHTGQPGEGWIAVLADYQEAARARIFKVPHHGSQNGDYPDVWKKLLLPNPIAVVTPFSAGVRLPKRSDLTRLCTYTPNVYCTVEGAGKPPGRDPSVEREMRRFAKDRRILQGQPGHVRIRWTTTQPEALPVIDLFYGARHVCPN